MTSNSISLNEKKNQRKAKTLSGLFHVGILLLILYPFLTRDTPDPEPMKFVEIQFTDFKSSSSKSSEGNKKEKLDAEKKIEATTKEEEVKETVPEPVVEETKPEPEVKPEPTPAPAKAPVLTSPEPNPPVRTSPEKPKVETPAKKPTKVIIKPDPKPRTPSRPSPSKPKKKVDKPSKADTGKTSSTEQAGTNKPTNSGGGEAPEKGKDATQGKTDSGTSVGDFPGDGLFNRKVIYRADVKSVTKEEGKIVIDLCVNQAGRVVYSKYNKPASSIKTTSVVRKALEIAQKYRFERDNTAPQKQCGKLTFIFEIEEE